MRDGRWREARESDKALSMRELGVLNLGGGGA